MANGRFFQLGFALLHNCKQQLSTPSGQTVQYVFAIKTDCHSNVIDNVGVSWSADRQLIIGYRIVILRYKCVMIHTVIVQI